MCFHTNRFKEENWAVMKKLYKNNGKAYTFLSNFEHVDVAAVTLGANSTSLWIISPPDLDRLIDDLEKSIILFHLFLFSLINVF